MASTPRYEAVKVGDRYEFVRGDEDQRVISSAMTATGGLMALYGLMRGGLFGTVTLATGAGLIYHGVTGRNPLQRLICNDRPRSGRPEEAPSYQNDEHARARQLPADEVDEASMESFPASDAPAHTRRA
jgi:hypothetical protein